MLNKTLFIGPIKDLSGYAAASRNYIRALILSGHKENLSLRSVRYDSGNKQVLPKELADLHKTKVDTSIHTIVQMLTPNEMRPVDGKRNIAICCWETDRIPEHWVSQLNKFDEIIVPCEDNKEAFINSGVKPNITKVPFVFFKDDYVIDNTNKFIIPGVGPETVKYYNISQWSPKKGIDELIQAYYLAFQNDEDVILVLKGYINMRNQAGDAQKMLERINQIRNAMRLPKFPKIYVTDVMMSQSDVLKLHASCDIYVNMSKGEGWGIPAYESLVMGKELISVEHTGMKEYLTDICNPNPLYYGLGTGQKRPVYNMGHPDIKLYTSLENWYEPDVLEAAKAFKESYGTLSKRNVGRDWIIDPVKIGNQLVEIING